MMMAWMGALRGTDHFLRPEKMRKNQNCGVAALIAELESRIERKQMVLVCKSPENE